MRPGRYAAIDIGTVTCRLLVADVDETGLHELERGYGITNLGEGVDATGSLKPAAMRRVAKQVEAFLDTIEAWKSPEHPTIPTVAIATSASRDAENSSVFLGLLDGLGVRPSIISGDCEAALTFRGVSDDFPDEDLLVVDVGGGSTEVTAGNSLKKAMLSHSFDVGCRRVTERFLPSDPPQEDELARARHWIAQTMCGYFEELAEAGFSIGRLVAVAGTATTTVSIQKQMAVYDSSQVHRSIVTKQGLLEVYDSLRALKLGQRKLTVGLDPGRASVIVAGLLILDVVMDLSGQNCFTASEADILQGIILDTAAK